MPIPGRAEPAATTAFAQEQIQYNGYHPGAYRRLGKTELTASRLGFGTYRCHLNNSQHARALDLALQRGCNLIDTAPNYLDGMAEELIGEVLSKAIRNGTLQRKEVILVSKVGYLQGEDLSRASRRESRGQPFPEVVKFREDLWHCIHPDCIADQIDRSLERLQVTTLDVYLLHNPEYFLLDALQRGAGDAAAVFEEFYHRLEKAFAALEELAASGKIQYYGISSNALPLERGRRDHVNLLEVWQAYQDMCRKRGIAPREGHFAFLQFPFNWLETEALTVKDKPYEGQKYSLLELARHFGLVVLTNRPLNAIRRQQVYRLARYHFREEVDYPREVQQQIEELQKLEQVLRENIALWEMDFVLKNGRKLSEHFHYGESLQEILPRLQEIAQLDQLLATHFVPQLQTVGQEFVRKLPRLFFSKGQALIQAVFRQFNRTTRIIKEYLNFQSYQRVSHLEKRFDAAYPDLAQQLTFSQKALLVAASAPGVDVVLTGMRTPEYVRDSLETLRYAPLKELPF